MEKFEEKQLINSLGSQINKQKKLLTDMVENLEYYYPRWKQDPEADKNLLNQVYLVYQYAYSCLWYMKDQKILEFIKLIDSNTGIFGGNRGKVIVNGQSMNQKMATQQMGANGKVFESIYYEAFGKQNKQPKPTKKNPMVIPQEQSDDFFNCMQAYAFYNEHLKEEFNKLKTNFGSSKYYHKINNTLGKVLKTIGTCISIGVGIVAAAGVLATALVGAGAVVAIPAGMTAIAGGVATVCKHGGQIGQAYRHGKVTKKYGRLVKELILTTLGIGKILIGAGIIEKPDILGKVMELFKKGETDAAAAEMTKIVKEAEIPEDKSDEIAEQIAEMQQLSEDVEDVAPTDDIKEEFFSKVEISNEGETNIDTLVQDAPEEPEILSSAEQLANNGGDATEAATDAAGDATDAAGEVEITPEEVDQEVAEVLNNPNEVAQDIEEVSADQSVLDKTPESAEQAEVEIEQEATPEPETEVQNGAETNGAEAQSGTEQGTETSTEQGTEQGTETSTEQATDNTQQSINDTTPIASREYVRDYVREKYPNVKFKTNNKAIFGVDEQGNHIEISAENGRIIEVKGSDFNGRYDITVTDGSGNKITACATLGNRVNTKGLTVEVPQGTLENNQEYAETYRICSNVMNYANKYMPRERFATPLNNIQDLANKGLSVQDDDGIITIKNFVGSDGKTYFLGKNGESYSLDPATLKAYNQYVRQQINEKYSG